MPNHIILASGAAVAVSAVLATALALYESPELRRYTDDVRRRIAIALHSLGDGIRPPDYGQDYHLHSREPLFNRPEDADGFLQSRRGPGAQPGVDADDATRRSQREELMYWNSVRLQKQEEQQRRRRLGDLSRPAGSAESKTPTTPASDAYRRQAQAQTRPHVSRAGSSFEDFLEPAHGQDDGALVVCSGAQAHENTSLRHRGDGTRSSPLSVTAAAAATMYANPFSDEYHVDPQELGSMELGTERLVLDDNQSDIYSATTKDADGDFQTRSSTGTLDFADDSSSPCLINFDTATAAEATAETKAHLAVAESSPPTYASIQAWAAESGSVPQSSPLYAVDTQTGRSSSEIDGGHSFYAVESGAEAASNGELTPTDSMSFAGSIENYLQLQASSLREEEEEQVRSFDVLSETTEDMLTPATWSEVGSQISEGENLGAGN